MRFRHFPRVTFVKNCFVFFAVGIANVTFRGCVESTACMYGSPYAKTLHRVSAYKHFSASKEYLGHPTYVISEDLEFYCCSVFSPDVHNPRRGPGARPRLKSWGFGSQHRGACGPRPAKGRTGCWGRKGVAPSRCEGSGVSPPENFLKTQMLNPAFWWLLAVKFLAFWKLRPRSWGDQYIVGPQPKSWEDQSPPVSTVVAPMQRPPMYIF